MYIYYDFQKREKPLVKEGDYQGTEEKIASLIQFWRSKEPSFIQKTSGSTGTPKNIQITRQQVVASVRGTAQALNLQQGDTACLCINPEYIGGKMMVFRALLLGLKLHVFNPSSDVLLNTNFPINSFTALVPLQVQKLHEFSRSLSMPTFGKARWIIGGAPLGRVEEIFIKRLNFPIYATFGMTETASHFALRHINSIDNPKNYRLLPGVELKQFDGGRLKIRGEISNNKWLHTNDIISKIDDNTFQWIGRADFIINSGGIKINPEQVLHTIQNKLPNSLPPHDVCTLGLPDEKLGEKLVLVLAKLPQGTQEKIISAYIHTFYSLNKFKIPKAIYSIESLPKQNEKLHRGELKIKLKNVLPYKKYPFF